MVQYNSHGYYQRREQHERQMAQQSSMPEVAAIHREMAQRYAMLVDEALIEERGARSRIFL